MNLSDFEKKWFEEISQHRLKSFPDFFIEENEHTLYDLPGKPLLKGSELFGKYELMDTDGNSILNSDNLDLIKYILYANRNYPKQIRIPSNPEQISDLVVNYENHLDEIIKEIKGNFRTEFPSSSKNEITINKIFQRLNLYRY